MPEANLEAMVGYKALSIIRDSLREYILAHTVKGKYIGNLGYIKKYIEIDALFNRK